MRNLTAHLPTPKHTHAFAHTLKSFKTTSGISGKLYSLPALASSLLREIKK